LGAWQAAERPQTQTGVTPAAKDAIIAEGYDPQFGARPMRRAIQRLVQDPLALKLLNGDFLEGDTIEVDAEPGATEFNSRSSSTSGWPVTAGRLLPYRRSSAANSLSTMSVQYH
jgi:hypothetical protein